MSWLYFVLPFITALVLTPVLKVVAAKFNLYAPVNERTIHRTKIARIGGIAIFLAFVLATVVFIPIDQSMLGVLAGATIIFVTGLIDDIVDIKPLVKLLMQVLSALVLMYAGGVSLDKFNLPFGLVITNEIILDIITFTWIVGVTNAINLIDGLDGLASGICLIVLIILYLIAVNFGGVGYNSLLLVVILMGTIIGFLPYNFYPASIFLGDCGAQLLGYLMACITIMSFKSTAFITLLVPFAMLFVPLVDSLVTIIRRKITGKKITDADKHHLHHVLMFDLNLGHRRTVLVLYGVSAIFAGTAYLYRYDQVLGTIVLLFLVLLFEVFIEYTGMINSKYHPILSFFKWISKNKDE